MASFLRSRRPADDDQRQAYQGADTQPSRSGALGGFRGLVDRYQPPSGGGSGAGGFRDALTDRAAGIRERAGGIGASAGRTRPAVGPPSDTPGVGRSVGGFRGLVDSYGGGGGGDQPVDWQARRRLMGMSTMQGGRYGDFARRGRF